MEAQLEQKLVQIIARHDQFLKRTARMLAAIDRREALPGDAEFHEHELKSLDGNSSDLAVELVGSIPAATDWTPPVRFAYDRGYLKPGPATWLKELQQGLRLSKSYFELFLPVSSRELHMGDKITVGAAHVVMGSHAKAGNINASGPVNSGQISSADLQAIADELALLRKSCASITPLTTWNET